MKRGILLDPNDGVATLLAAVEPGDRVTLRDAGDRTVGELSAAEAIPFAHKIAVCPIARGETIRKRGMVIGVASADIAAGAYVHVHNLQSIEGMRGVQGWSLWDTAGATDGWA